MKETITLYHGDDFNGALDGDRLMVERMHTGNLQTGTGVSFASKISIAESYGKIITTTEVKHNFFMNSREIMEDETIAFHNLNHPEIQIDPSELFTELILDLHKLNLGKVKGKEDFELFDLGLYNLATDYFEVDEETLFEECMASPSSFDSARDIIYSIVGNLLQDEVRNFQINMADHFNIQDFQKTWQKHLPSAIGTYDKDTDFYAIINDKDLVLKKHKPEKKEEKTPNRPKM